MIRKLSVFSILVLSVILPISAFGCRPSMPATAPVPAQPQNVVEVIQIFKGRLQTSPPSTQILVRPLPDWASGLPVNPHPDNVQGVYSQGDKIWLGLRLTPKTPVTFSRYTFFNKGTGEEVKIDWHQTGLGVGVPAADLGPFESQAFPFFDNPLRVPDEPGIYEIRVYRDDVIAASAVFEVKAVAVLTILILPAWGEFGVPPPGGWERIPIASPHPTNVQRVFYPGNKMFLAVRINPQYEASVTFSKYTLFNKGSGQEKELASSPRDVGPFEPGAVLFPAIGNPWVAPNETGIHEIRVYSNNEVVASAVFEVN